MMNRLFSTVEQAIQAIADGRVIIVVDAEDRENEGDFVCAAELATKETINFMLNGRGQLCVSILEETATRCELTPVVSRNNAPLATAFLTPIDHHTSKTGITADERCTTIRALVDPSTSAKDFVRPGHVFPLLAREGGVLRRAGHTEASMDLARLAGLTPAGVLCEILDEQGERPARDYLFNMAAQENLPIISIQQLIEYRRRLENYVHRVAEAQVSTKHGPLRFVVYNVDCIDQQPLALVLGDTTTSTAPLVRVHSSCITSDLIRSMAGDDGNSLQMSLNEIRCHGVGVVICLPQDVSASGLADQIRAYASKDGDEGCTKTDHATRNLVAEGDFTVGMRILKDLGLQHAFLEINDGSQRLVA
jgi:3,4-dihydroxy 2-butanone 4-phosphate synthase / GTP cyclohydrolase II